MSEERWEPIPGYEGIYEVSDRGRVKSLPRWRVRTERIASCAPDGAGYRVANLCRDGQSRSVRVHELVLLAFVGPRPTGCAHTRHLDGNPANNNLTNLRYGSVSENMHDRIRHGTHHEVNKTHCSKGHAFTAENIYRLPSRPRSRYCRSCAADNRNQRRARQRAAGLPVT